MTMGGIYADNNLRKSPRELQNRKQDSENQILHGFCPYSVKIQRLWKMTQRS